MNEMFALFNLGGPEILLVLAVILIMFGAKKIPDLAKGLGQGIKEFKKATREVTDEIQNSVNSTPTPLPPPPAPMDRQIVEATQVEKPAAVAQSSEHASVRALRATQTVEEPAAVAQSSEHKA